jgi:hypothetical protein
MDLMFGNSTPAEETRAARLLCKLSKRIDGAGSTVGGTDTM